MRVDIQSVRQTYKQTLDKFSIKQEQTDGRERYNVLYIQIAEPVVSHNISHYWHVWMHALTQRIYLVLTFALIQETWGCLWWSCKVSFLNILHTGYEKQTNRIYLEKMIVEQDWYSPNDLVYHNKSSWMFCCYSSTPYELNWTTPTRRDSILKEEIIIPFSIKYNQGICSSESITAQVTLR